MNAAAMTETDSITAADNAATAPHDGRVTVAVADTPTGTGLIMAPTATAPTANSASAVKGTTATTWQAFTEDPVGLSTKKFNKINISKYKVNTENKANTESNHWTLEVQEEGVGVGTISER